MVHTIFVVLLLILLALLLLVHSSSLLAAGGLGRAIFFGMAMFWGVRLLVQLCYYDRSLWRGRTGKTLIHIGVTMLCLYFRRGLRVGGAVHPRISNPALIPSCVNFFSSSCNSASTLQRLQCQIQPAPPHRGRTGRQRDLRQGDVESLIDKCLRSGTRTACPTSGRG